MRLVACSNCHAQYDVAGVEAKFVPCRCGERIDTEALRAVEAAIRRCSACGGTVEADVPSCTYCGSTIERDPHSGSLICPECFAHCADDARFCTACGVGFSPEPLVTDQPELPCPVCSALMAPQHVAGVPLNECSTCRGLWVSGDGFDVLVNRAIEAHLNPEPESAPKAPPRVAGSNPASQRVQYRKCPECDAFMQRRNYRKKSGVIIDSCSHGTWLDADELERIAGFIRSQGGETIEPEDSEKRRHAAIAAGALARFQPPKREFGSFGSSNDSGGGVVGSLLGLLNDLLE